MKCRRGTDSRSRQSRKVGMSRRRPFLATHAGWVQSPSLCNRRLRVPDAQASNDRYAKDVEAHQSERTFRRCSSAGCSSTGWIEGVRASEAESGNCQDYISDCDIGTPCQEQVDCYGEEPYARYTAPKMRAANRMLMPTPISTRPTICIKHRWRSEGLARPSDSNMQTSRQGG
jgi:hypothetical protein